MPLMLTSPATIETLADLLEQLGGIAPERVRFRPPPGTAADTLDGGAVLPGFPLPLQELFAELDTREITNTGGDAC
jgi:hypothetical protein